MTTTQILIGDARERLKELPSKSVHCCVTSPPYWQLRDYGAKGQLGLEGSPELYISEIIRVFREVKRVLRSDGTCWLNLGDTYMTAWVASRSNSATSPASSLSRRDARRRNSSGIKPKNLIGIPWRVALALQADGWYLRSDVIWHKPNPLPESVKDRPTRSHEYLFLLTKSPRYHYDADPIREPHRESSYRRVKNSWAVKNYRKHPSGGVQTLNPAQCLHPLGRNKRTVWYVPVRGYKGIHSATFPEKLIEPCILAGCPIGGTVLDPFAGTGTTMRVAARLGRRAIGIEINPDFAK